MKKKNNLIYILFLLFAIASLSLSIGYAQVSGTVLDISGSASLNAQTGIVITNVVYSSSNNANPSDSVINSTYQTLLDSTIVLGNDATSTITYQVTISNLTNEDYEFSNAIFDENFYDNDKIIFELNNITTGTPLLANQTVTFNITYRYAGSDISNNTLNSYINFKFRKHNSVYVTFNTNGGDPVETLELSSGDSIGTLPTITKEICDSTEGTTPEERGCTYLGTLVGWYLEPEFTTQVDSTYSVTSDIILYAKWHSTYERFQKLEIVNFDGIDDYLDTGINLLSEDNINKDFDLSFDIISFDRDFINDRNNLQVSMLNAKDESQGTYPGFVVRFNTGASDKISINYRWGSKNSSKTITTSSLPIHFEIKRRNGIVYASISSDAATQAEAELYNQSTYTLTEYCPTNVVFGSSYDSNGNAFRFFKGELANMSLVAYE